MNKDTTNRRTHVVTLELHPHEMEQLAKWLSTAEVDYRNFNGWGDLEEALSDYIHSQLAATGVWPLPEDVK